MHWSHVGTVQRSPFLVKEIRLDRCRRQANQFKSHPRRLTSVDGGGIGRPSNFRAPTMRSPRPARSFIQLSILIATLESRKPQFERLHGKLVRQAEAASGEVEILFERDAGEAPIGRKRNTLLASAGFTLARIVPTGTQLSIVEGMRA